jgi:cytochrome c oxidase assembly factor CtaG
MHMTLLGALLSLSPCPLYGAGEVTCFGAVLDAGQDQQVGGVVMLLVGAVVYLAGGISLFAHCWRIQHCQFGKTRMTLLRNHLRRPASLERAFSRVGAECRRCTLPD